MAYLNYYLSLCRQHYNNYQQNNVIHRSHPYFVLYQIKHENKPYST